MLSKRLVLLMFFLTPLFLVTAEDGKEKGQGLIKKGFGMETRLYSALYSDNGEGAFKWDMTLMPTLHYQTENNLEFAPYLLVRYEKDSNEELIVNTDTVHTDLNRLSVGLGSGFYWTFVESRAINVLSGFRTEFLVIFPQWGSSSPTGYNFDPGRGAITGTVDIPLGFEVNPFSRLHVRIWMEALRLGLRWDEEYYRDDIIDRTITFFSYSPFWTSDWAPSSNSDWVPYPTPISFSFIWAF